MRKTETLNLRVSAAFKRKLAHEAKQARRSLTNYLETTLEELWRRDESVGKGPKITVSSEVPRG